MFKWFLILFGGGALVIGLIFCFFLFMIWNYPRGFPKSVLVEELKETCLASKKPFVLIKNRQGYLSDKLFALLPKPDGKDYFYRDYIPGTFSDPDGSEAEDLSEAIKVPSGTKFILKDGYLDRTINESRYYFWLESEALALDSTFIYALSSLALRRVVEGEARSLRKGKVVMFPDTDLFETTCDE